MSTIIDLMLAVRENSMIFYHKDTKCFDNRCCSDEELKNLSFDKKLEWGDEKNSIPLPLYSEIDHKEIMGFYVREFVEDKEVRKKLFYILRRREYMDAYINALQELDLYEDFIDVCGDIYMQIFNEWAEKNGLTGEFYS